MNKKEYVFVYGTLKKDHINNTIMNSFDFEGLGETTVKYQMYPAKSGAFPFIIKSEPNNYIKGEVYSTKNPLLLIDLDEYEGFPSLYLREEIDIILDSGIRKKAWIYYKNEDKFKNYIDLSKPISNWEN